MKKTHPCLAAIASIALMACLLPLPAMAQGTPTDEDQAAIDEALRIEQAPAPSILPRLSGGAQSMNPDLGLVLNVGAAAFDSDRPLQLGEHDPARPGFNFQQLELSLASAVDPFFHFDSHLVVGPEGFEVEEAFAETTALPANLQLRAGQFLTRFGRINPTHVHQWDFVDQPLVIGKFFGPEGNRGVGAEASWLSPLPWYLELLVSSTDATGEGTARSFLGASEDPISGPGDLQTTTALKQFFPFGSDWSLGWGLSGAFGPAAADRSSRTEIYGTDVYLKYRPVEGDGYPIVAATAEAMARRRQLPTGELADRGGYASLVWRFDPTWSLGARYEQVGGLADDPLDPDWTASRRRTSVALGYAATEFSRVRLQGTADLPGWRDAYYAAFLTFEVSVGAHGAHAF